MLGKHLPVTVELREVCAEKNLSDLMLRSLGHVFSPATPPPDVESFRSLTLRFIDLVPSADDDEFESRPGDLFSEDDALPIQK